MKTSPFNEIPNCQIVQNATIISVPEYSFISSESGLLFSRSSTQTYDPEVKIPILLRQNKPYFWGISI
jgi:hypothetical protein